MEKKELGVEQYVTTGTMFITGEFKPEKKSWFCPNKGKRLFWSI